VPSATRSGSRSPMYIDSMSESDSKQLIALLLILGPRRAVFEERRGRRPARLVVAGIACRGVKAKYCNRRKDFLIGY